MVVVMGVGAGVAPASAEKGRPVMIAWGRIMMNRERWRESIRL